MMQAALKTADGRFQVMDVDQIRRAGFAFRGSYPVQGMTLDLLARDEADAQSLVPHRLDLDLVNGAPRTADAEEEAGAVLVVIATS